MSEVIQYPIQCESCQEIFIILLSEESEKQPKYCPICGDVNLISADSDVL